MHRYEVYVTTSSIRAGSLMPGLAFAVDMAAKSVLGDECKVIGEMTWCIGEVVMPRRITAEQMRTLSNPELYKTHGPGLVRVEYRHVGVTS